MDKRDDGGPAFPRDHRSDGHNGMSLRDYFAGQALPMLIDLLRHDAHPGLSYVDYCSQQAYVMADAMLKARHR